MRKYDFAMNRLAPGLTCLLVMPLALAAGAAGEARAPQTIESLLERGIRFEHGEGLARNGARAAELYCAAARQGSAEGAYRLGWMYANGRGIARDDGYAVALFRRAAARGHEYATRMLARIHSDAERLPDCVAGTDPAPSAVAGLTRAEQLAASEHARVAAAKNAPAQAVPDVAVQAAPLPDERAKARPAMAGAPPGRPDPEQAVTAAIADWARAWSQKDMDAYLSAYADDFAAASGLSQAQWAKGRRARIVGKDWIEVGIRDLQIRVEGTLARARFVQEYRSDRWNERGMKRLTLVNQDGNWRIRQEENLR